MLNEEKDNACIQGVRFREVPVHNLHSFYADDIRLTMKASKENVLRSRTIFDTFGAASGLYCDWSKTKAVYLAPGPIQHFLADLNWTWESQETASKYLGIFMGNQISRVLANKHLLDKLNLRLDRLSKDISSLSARVVIANHLIVSMLWYTLSLWVALTSTSNTYRALLRGLYGHKINLLASE